MTEQRTDPKTQLKLSGVLGEYLGGQGDWESRCNIIFAAISSDQNNFSPPGWSTADIVIVDPTGADRTITGFDANAEVKCKTIFNLSFANNLIVPNEDSGSDAANRVALPSADPITLDGGDMTVIVYLGAATRWGIADKGISMSIADNYLLGRGTTGQAERLTPAQAHAVLDTAPPEVKIKVYSQAAEPTLAKAESLAVWIDTDDSNRQYLISKAGAGQKKVEFT